VKTKISYKFMQGCAIQLHKAEFSLRRQVRGRTKFSDQSRFHTASTQWSQATQEDVAAFLSHWRVHRLALLQSAYHALHDLVIGGWYADESTWESIGYPGPMRALS
jgi:hypothetical protein